MIGWLALSAALAQILAGCPSEGEKSPEASPPAKEQAPEDEAKTDEGTEKSRLKAVRKMLQSEQRELFKCKKDRQVTGTYRASAKLLTLENSPHSCEA